MADNNFRSYRRDPVLPGGASGVAAPARGQQAEDPLAELARLIGQREPGEPANNPDRAARDVARDAARHYEAPPLNGPAPGSQWATDDRYAQPQERTQEPAQDQYDERQGQYSDPYPDQYQDQYAEPQDQYAERYDAPRLPDPQPPYRPAPPSYNAEYEQPAAEQYPAPPQRYAADARGYADQPRYDDEHDPIQDLPSFLPRARADRQGYHSQDYAEDQQDGGNDQSYALEDYEEEEAPPGKRRGFATVAAVLGLVVLGTAGAFAYHAMFGGSMLPSLPPIIKADDSPNKIVPAGSSTAASGQANASKSVSPDKLVSREEKPVDVPVPANTPRVVSTIPIFPDPNAGLQSSVAGGQGMTQGMTQGATQGMTAGSVAGGPGAAVPGYGGSVAPAPAMPLPGMAGQGAATGAAMQAQPPAAASSGTKKIHTVAIHPGQSGDADATAAAPPAAAAPARAPAPSRPAAPRPLAATAPQGGNAPLSIVPSQGDTPVARTRTAVARPAAPSAAAEPAPSAGGGYSVQVSSQRSEAEAQSAYRGLQAKYPSQLSGHTPTVRQVDLGDKGVFYRTLVGPYGSAEQAAQMCSSLKAAGGSCIVQRN
jgi:SPOR domain